MPATDGHVHTEWSWDTRVGSMERSCARAVHLGLPSIAFTEHADATGWLVEAADLDRMPAHFRTMRGPDGVLRPPPLDVDGYLAGLERCRERFPDLRILAGVELSEPHWHPAFVSGLLARADFQRILGSVHTLRDSAGNRMVDLEYRTRPAGEVVREYLAEVLRLVESGSPFAVLAHIDYPIRDWPAAAGPYRPGLFEDEYRTVLRALARSDRALEVNTQVPLSADVVRWWADEGGTAVTFGSDAHRPDAVAAGFGAAVAMAEAYGFRAQPDPHAVWIRSGP
jgi:histidinol-phosphatase (PHP family)